MHLAIVYVHVSCNSSGVHKLCIILVLHSQLCGDSMFRGVVLRCPTNITICHAEHKSIIIYFYLEVIMSFGIMHSPKPVKAYV